MTRTTLYDPAFAAKVQVLCEQGATIQEVADFLQVSERTVRNWSHEHAEFFMALKNGRAAADTRVEQSLYRRALGYSHEAVKHLVVNGRLRRERYTEQYPPDTLAAIFWLKNRRPDEWRDVKAVSVTGRLEHDHRHAVEFTDEELAALIASDGGAGVTDPAPGEGEAPGVH